MNLIKNNCDLSIFVPCLNEAENIISTIQTIKSTLENFNLIYEIIVVDDNSKDNTYKVVEKYQRENPYLNIILIKNNFTKGIGVNYIDSAFVANGKYYMLVNGDNAEPEQTLIFILKEFNKADMIIPYFGKNDNRSFLRVIISKIFTFFINFLSGYKVPYYNGPVLHLRYNVMRWSPDTHGYAYQAELITRILFEGASFKTVLIHNNKRSKGKSSAFTIQNIFSVAHSILQIFFRRLRALLFYRNK